MRFAIINSVCGYGSTGKNVLKNQANLTQLGHRAVVYYGMYKNSEEHSECCYFGNRLSLSISYRLGDLFGVHGMLSFLPTFKLLSALRKYKPDIVWLNNIHGDYVNEYILLSFLKKQGIMTVYSMPDEYAFLGKCTNVLECTKYTEETGCHHCPLLNIYPKSKFFDNSRIKFRLKKKAYEGFNNIVFRSAPYVIANARKSVLLREKEMSETDSAVDMENTFYPRDTQPLRKELGIAENKRVVLLCAPLSDAAKGSVYYLQAAELCHERGEDVVFLHVAFDGKKDSCPPNFIPLPYEKNQQRLAEYYSMADAYVCTSIADAQPNACLEALGCGTPLIGFNISGVPYIAPNQFGTFVAPKDSVALADAICAVVKKTNESISACRDYALGRFSQAAAAARFEKFVNKICERANRRYNL